MGLSNRILYLSRIKALSCLAVVILHTFFAANGFADTAELQSCMFSVRNAMMWAVPCFVMASGALLLNNKRVVTMKKLFSKYILRMILALIVFSVIFSLFDGLLLKNSSASEMASDIFSDIFSGTGWAHMWYLYLMTAIYLMLPVYKVISSNIQSNDLKYLIAVYFAGLSVLPFIETISGKKLPFYICVFSVYPLYLFLGHALHVGMIKIPKKAAGLMFLICIGITAMLTAYAYSNAETDPQTSSKLISLLGDYSFPLYVVMSIGAFGFIRRTKNESFPLLDAAAAELDKCSFGIYLIHMAVLKFIFAVMKFDPFEHGGTITIIGIAAVTVVISYAVTRLLKLVPYVNKLI